MAILRGRAETTHAAAQEILRRAYGERDAVPPVTPEELVEHLQRRSIRLIDVRPEIEYRAAHIPGARNIPIMALAERLEGLPKRPRIVPNCLGPTCLLSSKS